MYICKLSHILQIVAGILHEKHRTYTVHYRILHSLTRHPVPPTHNPSLHPNHKKLTYLFEAAMTPCTREAKKAEKQ